MKLSLIQIGTSGWSYEHWNENFYPNEIKPKDRLKFYSHHFQSVEINSTFYHLPSEKAISKWHSEVQEDFTFSIKASGYITHRKRLKDPETVDTFLDRVEKLSSKRGPILFQLPPSFKIDEDRLAFFLEHLREGWKYVFEFRHSSWFVENIYHLLKKHQIGLCISDLNGKLTPEEVTSTFTYLRLHGPHSAYSGSYSKKALQEWAKKILHWQKSKISVYCYFDNDEKGFAIKNALELKHMIEGK